jgi:hypothetical protein
MNLDKVFRLVAALYIYGMHIYKHGQNLQYHKRGEVAADSINIVKDMEDRYKTLYENTESEEG